MSRQLNLYFYGGVIFQNNIVENGSGIFITDYCTVVFDKTSNVTFINNSANHNGAAVFLNDHSHVRFSVMTFYYNKASNGTVYCKINSNMIFNGSCQVTFNSNSATHFGTAMYSLDNFHVAFARKSNVTFSYNVIPFSEKDGQVGGTMYSEAYGYISFEEKSIALFRNNITPLSAAIFLIYYSNISFIGKSLVTFNSNTAQICRTVTSALSSTITFNANTQVALNANTVSCTSSECE